MKWQDPIQITIDALNAGINPEGSTDIVPISLSRPGTEEKTHFIRVMLLGGMDRVQRGYVESSMIEVESWGSDAQIAWNGLMEARQAINSAAGSNSPIRHVEDAAKPSELPTGENAWYRFRMAFYIDLSTRGDY